MVIGTDPDVERRNAWRPRVRPCVPRPTESHSLANRNEPDTVPQTLDRIPRHLQRCTRRSVFDSDPNPGDGAFVLDRLAMRHSLGQTSRRERRTDGSRTPRRGTYAFAQLLPAHCE